jgi:hypothetical protein
MGRPYLELTSCRAVDVASSTTRLRADQYRHRSSAGILPLWNLQLRAHSQVLMKMILKKKRKKEERKGVLFRRRLKDYCRAIYSRGKDLSLIPETQRSASERLHFT